MEVTINMMLTFGDWINVINESRKQGHILNPFKKNMMVVNLRELDCRKLKDEDMKLFAALHMVFYDCETKMSQEDVARICGEKSFKKALPKLKKLYRAGLISVVPNAPYPIPIVREVAGMRVGADKDKKSNHITIDSIVNAMSHIDKLCIDEECVATV